MKNHFHLLVKVLPENEIDFIKPKENDKRVFKEKKKYNPTKQFSHLFDSYAKKFNYQNDRTGKLFETPFRRILIDSEDYFRHLVYYIHYNPVKHGFTASPEEYSWSSYNDFLSVTDTNQQYSEVLKWFSSKQEFIQFHKNKFDDEIFKNLI
jgi:REP element-mobilizing transposase RayT